MGIDEAYRNGMLHATQNAEERCQALLARCDALRAERDALLSKVAELEQLRDAQPARSSLIGTMQNDKLALANDEGEHPCASLRQADG